MSATLLVLRRFISGVKNDVVLWRFLIDWRRPVAKTRIYLPSVKQNRRFTNWANPYPWRKINTSLCNRSSIVNLKLQSRLRNQQQMLRILPVQVGIYFLPRPQISHLILCFLYNGIFLDPAFFTYIHTLIFRLCGSLICVCFLFTQAILIIHILNITINRSTV